MKPASGRSLAPSSFQLPPSQSLSRNSRRIIGLALVLTAALALTLIALLSYRILTNFSGIKPEAADNVGWSLSQVEVDASDFNNAVQQALSQPEIDLSHLRLRFDILYSRTNTLRLSPQYRRVEVVQEYRDALNALWGFMQFAVPLIDGNDQELRDSLPAFHNEANTLRNLTRTLSVTGSTFFAKAGDADRAAIATMLLQLAVLAILLVATLAALAAYVLSIYRRANRRGIALQQANQRMQTILTTSLDGVIVTDLDGNVLEFNKAAERTLGYSFDEVRGRPIIELVAPDDMLETHLANARKIRNREAGTIEGKGRVTLRAKRKTGEVFPIELSIQRADDGQQELFIAFLHDISKRVAAEEELLETRDKALAGERAKAEFLTMMSHEIRTPLNGILGNLSLLDETDLSQAQTRYVRNMGISGRVLMRHVDSVLDIARFQSGAMEFDISCTDLSAMLDELVNSQVGQAEQQGTALSWHWVGPKLDWARTDRAALEQVLLNLLGNAIKFTPGGKVTIEIEVQPPASTAPHTDHPMVEFRVIDTGIGILSQDLDRVFDDFVTSDTSFDRATGGTGLGLGISRRIVQGLGGTIGVQSTPGEGSTFWVRLPMEKGRAPGSVDTPPVPSEATRPMTVLLVEDNAINREVASEILTNDGHTVVTAQDGETGVAHANAGRFDLILMDITMPGMDGLAATRAIRGGRGASQDVPIIAVSANILPQEMDRFLAAGMNGFLAKPLNIQDMRRALAGLDLAKIATPLQTLDAEQYQANRDGMGDTTFQRLRDRFIAEIDSLLVDFTGTGNAEREVLAIKLHTSAGSAAVFGASRLRQALLDAETQIKSQPSLPVTSLHADLTDIWTVTKEALQAETAPF